WYNAEIQSSGGERGIETGKRYLASIAAVFHYAIDLGYLTESPVDPLRRSLSRRERSKQGRARATSKANPFEREAVGRLVAEARVEGPLASAFTLCQLDAGLRRGEAAALRWRSIAWGASEDDPRRHLHVTKTRSRRSTTDEAPKSGRARRVQLSRRLRAALSDLFKAHRPATLDAYVFEKMDGDEYDKVWARIIARADLPGRTPKDLRHTFASWLLSCGIPLKYISLQLGHSTSAVTESNYAKWIPGDGGLYVEPVRLEPGEVPADLLTRLPESHQSATTGDPYALPDSLKSSDLH
ncbi:MAG: tyrosine-type recombinase/integrase, partial [Myxococcota bacterium]